MSGKDLQPRQNPSPLLSCDRETSSARLSMSPKLVVRLGKPGPEAGVLTSFQPLWSHKKMANFVATGHHMQLNSLQGKASIFSALNCCQRKRNLSDRDPVSDTWCHLCLAPLVLVDPVLSSWNVSPSSLAGIGNSPRGSALTGSGDNQRRIACTHRSSLCVEQGIYMSFRTSSDRAMVTPPHPEQVRCQQPCQHHSQWCASKYHLGWLVCSTLCKGISNLEFLGFQRVPCIALGSASFIWVFLFFSLASCETQTFFSPF